MMLPSPRDAADPPPTMAPLDPSTLPMSFDAAAAAAATPPDAGRFSAIEEQPRKQQRQPEEDA